MKDRRKIGEMVFVEDEVPYVTTGLRSLRPTLPEQEYVESRRSKHKS